MLHDHGPNKCLVQNFTITMNGETKKEIYLEEIDTWKLHYSNGSNSSEQKMRDVGQVLLKQDIYLAA
jgi:hypothetical protein